MVDEVKQIIQEVSKCPCVCPRGGCVLIKAHHVQSVEGVLGASSYQNNKVNQWTSSVVEQCLNQLTKLQKPFKYIGRLIQDNIPPLKVYVSTLSLSLSFSPPLSLPPSPPPPLSLPPIQ